jgi:hypothetical protein
MSIQSIHKLAERRNKRLIGNESFLIQLIERLTELRENDHAISIIAQTLYLGIVPEGGDGD